MLILSPAQRRYLRARAHKLQPTVIIGQSGVTSALTRELDRSLVKHELVKVRALSADRDERAAIAGQLCTAVQAGWVQSIGKVVVLYRPAEKPVLKLPEE
jgi:RNA-binding protein